jgi:hypothetical protein
MKCKVVQLLGGPSEGRIRLELIDDAPIPVTLSMPDVNNTVMAVYEYAGGGIYLFIGEERTDHASWMDRGEPL